MSGPNEKEDQVTFAVEVPAVNDDDPPPKPKEEKVGMGRQDSDRARDSKEVKELGLNDEESIEKVKDMSIGIACSLLENIGLSQYTSLFEEARVGIRELRGFDSDGLRELGIEDVVHRSRILGAAQEEHRADCPPGENGEPLKVRVKMGFGRLSDINTINGSLNIKLFVDLFWNDPRLIGVHKDHVPQDFLWYPDGYFYNSIDRTGEGGGHLNEHELVLMNPKTGLVMRPMELEITTSFEMDLRQFPFDENPIKFHFLQAEHQNANEFVFAPAKKPEASVKFFYDIRNTPEFDLAGYSLSFSASKGATGVKWSSVKLLIHARRKPMYYIWKSVLPLFITTLFGFATFFFEVDDLEARAATAQTILLTTVALLFVLATELPKTGYLTRIDKYLLWCLFIQALTLVVSCAHILRDFGDDVNPNEDELDKAAVVDFYAAIITPVLLVIGTLVAFAYPMFNWLRSTNERKPRYPLKVSASAKKTLEYYPLKRSRNYFA